MKYQMSLKAETSKQNPSPKQGLSSEGTEEVLRLEVGKLFLLKAGG